MIEFNEFLIKLNEIRKNMFLILIFFLFFVLPIISVIRIIKAKNTKKNEDKNESEKDFAFGIIIWILICIGISILMREFIYF